MKMKNLLPFILIIFFTNLLFAQPSFDDQQLERYFINNQKDKIENLLQEGLDPDYSFFTTGNILEVNNSSLLSFAVICQNLDLVKLLVQHNAKINGEYGSPALDHAISHQNMEIMQYLLDNKAKISVNSLSRALRSMNLDVVNKIFEYLPEHIKDEELFRELDIAAGKAMDEKNYSIAVNYYRVASQFGIDKIRLCRERGIAHLNLGYAVEAIEDFNCFLESSEIYYQELNFPEDLMMQNESLMFYYRGYAKMYLNEDKNSACADFRKSKLLGGNFESQESKDYCAN